MYPFAIGLGILLVIVFILWRVKSAFDLFATIVYDTLKVYNDKEKRLKWSATKCTMFVAFFTSIFMAVYDCYKNGLNEIVFGALLTVAITGKVANAWSKKIDPTIMAPKDSTNEQQTA